jgi:hypothetical protein
MTERNASDWPSLQISCNTVDAFQGKQADVCIYSVTLSNRRGKLRFLKENPKGKAGAFEPAVQLWLEAQQRVGFIVARCLTS